MMSCFATPGSPSVNGTIFAFSLRMRSSSSGMARGLEAQRGIVAVRLAIGKDGPNTIQILRELRVGKVRFHLRQHLGATRERACLLADGLRHRDEDAVDLRLLLIHQAHEFVVELDGLHRLDEDGLSRRRGAVDNAGNLAAELCLYGNHKAVAANGDEVFLRAARIADCPQLPAQALFDGLVLAIHRLANARKLRRRGVGERAVRPRSCR